ncbi:phytanoyl-CoA dioxygenase family protein [Paraburkholderia bannensis]|uniref:phytanoyl-CoA dioxygenase family protein n=1 Tax=Paraburkholderia bannensis TaxID=765414 RepID=UPI002AB65D91|nr:phytanoyl-CoA dioxygenase family protein [Paraburkholderia bannensis]
MKPHRHYREEDCSLQDFIDLVERDRDAVQTPHAHSVQHHVPMYDCTSLNRLLDDAVRRMALQDEWADVLEHGAGVFVLKHAYADTEVVDAASAVFEAIIHDERAAGGAAADHFAKAGANDRIWNAQQKLCLRAPEIFARYYANPMLVAASEAWLGPCYQMTAQVNVVRPGGAAQQAHRDYHLGFQSVEQAQRYPAQVHAMSPFLTLQGAVAHSDMPVESGPTKLLPFSQRYAPGYLAWRRQDFRDYFETHQRQLPLEKGDVIFFNPALFHAAGENRTAHVQRMANLLQVSSAYGRAMESLDRAAMCEALYPVLLEKAASEALTATEIDAAIASCAEGYPFPTNLDSDPPLGGLAPASQQMLFGRALKEAWPVEDFVAAIRTQEQRRLA